MRGKASRELRKLLLLPALVLPLGAVRSRRDLLSQTAILLLAVSAAAMLGLVEQARGAGRTIRPASTVRSAST